MENKKRKIPMKRFKSDLASIFKARLDAKGISTWQELADKVGILKGRKYIDFFLGGNTLSEEEIVKTFEVLEIPIEYLDLTTEKIVRYKIK